MRLGYISACAKILGQIRTSLGSMQVKCLFLFPFATAGFLDTVRRWSANVKCTSLPTQTAHLTVLLCGK